MRHMEPAECCRALGPEHILTPPTRRRARSHNLRRFAAAEFEDQSGGDLQPILDKARIETALKAVASVACDIEFASGRRGTDRIEQRGLDEHLGRGFGATRLLPPDHPAEALHASRVGDRSNFRIQRIFLSVEGEERLARPRQPDREIAVEPARVKDVQGPVEVEGQEIGDVDQRGDRPQPDRFEPVLQPCGARSIADAANVPPEEQRAGGMVLDVYGDR